MAETKTPPQIYAVAIQRIADWRCLERRTFEGNSYDKSKPGLIWPVRYSETYPEMNKGAVSNAVIYPLVPLSGMS